MMGISVMVILAALQFDQPRQKMFGAINTI